MKKKVTVTITKEDTGYSATASIGKNFVGTQGETLGELKGNILEAMKLTIPRATFDIKYIYDIGSFFNFYKVINAKALSERIGMNQSLLAQYIAGKKTPSTNQTKRILTGVHEIGKELVEAEFLV
jgi:predicted RNase H-like HicB family nuclease